jgi:hypothetical protein
MVRSSEQGGRRGERRGDERCRDGAGASAAAGAIEPNLHCALPSTAPPHRIDGPAPGRAARTKGPVPRASISPTYVGPVSISRKQSRRSPSSWLTTPSKHRPDGFSQLAACSVQHATCVQQDLCNMQRCSMQHTTCRIEHLACSVNCAPQAHSTPSAPRSPRRGHHRPACTARGIGVSTDRRSGTHRWLQARHRRGSAAAGGLGGRARRGLRDRGAHPPSQPVRCRVQWQSQRLARLASGREGRDAHV